VRRLGGTHPRGGEGRMISFKVTYAQFIYSSRYVRSLYERASPKLEVNRKARRRAITIVVDENDVKGGA